MLLLDIFSRVDHSNPSPLILSVGGFGFEKLKIFDA
jgi:hypothetical protein